MKIEDFAQARIEANRVGILPVNGSVLISQVLHFLIDRVEALEKASNAKAMPKCRKCGSTLQQQNDGDIGCKRCDIEEILSQYPPDEPSLNDHDDALSRMVSELEHTKTEEVLAKGYDSEASPVTTQGHSDVIERMEAAQKSFHGSEDDYVVIASRLEGEVGKFHYMTGFPFAWETADDVTKRQQYHWGKHKKDAKKITRRFALALLPELHRLFGRAPGSFTLQAPQADKIERLYEDLKEVAALVVHGPTGVPSTEAQFMGTDATGIPKASVFSYGTIAHGVAQELKLDLPTEPRKPVIESIHGEPYTDITINGSRRKAVVLSQLSYETIIVSYDPRMANIEPKDWPGFKVEFARHDSGQVGVVQIGGSVQVSPGMAFTINPMPAEPLLPKTKHVFNLDRDKFEVETEYMTGSAIKALLKNDEKQKHALYIECAGTGPDHQVADDEHVHVAGLDLYTVPPASFGAGPIEKCNHCGHESILHDEAGMCPAKGEVERLLGEAVEIIVNTEKETLYFKEGQPREITYEQVIRLACNQIDRIKGRPLQPPDYDRFPHMSVTYQHRVPFEQLPGERDGSLWKGKKVAVSPGMIINAYCT